MQQLKYSPTIEDSGDGITERLKQVEAELARLATESEPKTKKEREKRKSHQQSLIHSRDNLNAYLTLTTGQSVTDGKQLGVITQLTLSPGGLPEAWVSWYGSVPIPEQPERLKDEPTIKDLRVGDTITLNSKHPKFAGETFDIKEFRGGGWILTVDEHLFHQDFFTTPQDEFSQTPLPQATPAPITVEVADGLDGLGELTEDEQRDRLFLERKVERAFYEAGKALQELRDRRLYRSTHPTFESYCLERFGFKRRHPYRLIDAAQVFDNLIEMCPNWTQNENVSEALCHGASEELQMCPNWTQILPTSEYQIRPLTSLEPEQQVEAWTQAVESAGGKVPSSRIVSDIVQRIREKTRVPNPYRVGDVCTIIAKDNPDLRGLGGCWCIVIRIAEFSSIVRVWNGEYAVREENLKDLGYSPSQKEEMKQISDRLSRLYFPELEETAKAILASLWKINRSYLTEFEEKLLQFLEKEKS